MGVDNDVIIVRVEQLAANLVAALTSIHNILGVASEIAARGRDVVKVLNAGLMLESMILRFYGAQRLWASDFFRSKTHVIAEGNA